MTDIVERLGGYNPLDRVNIEQRQIAVDILDAKNEIERLRTGNRLHLELAEIKEAEIKQLRKDVTAFWNEIELMRSDLSIYAEEIDRLREALRETLVIAKRNEVGDFIQRAEAALKEEE